MKASKKFLSVFLALAMLLPCLMMSVSAQDSIEDQIQALVDEKMAVIIPQLEAQDALDQVAFFEEIVRDMITQDLMYQSGISPLEDGSENNVLAPQGGVVSYEVPRTWGVPNQKMLAIGCTKEQTDEWINKFNKRIEICRLIDIVMGSWEKLPSLVRSTVNLFKGLTVAMSNAVINDINACGGKALEINTYYSIDDNPTTVVMGWKSASIPVPYNALNIQKYVNKW